MTFASSAFAKKTAPKATAFDVADRFFHLQPRDKQAEKILASGRNNPKVPDALPEFCLVTMFEDAKARELFCKYFDEEIRQYAADCYNSHGFTHNRRMYAVISITKVLEAVEASRGN